MQFGDDGGSIHMVEDLPGTLIARNYAHALKNGQWSGEWPISNIYLDNRTKYVTVEHNVLEDGNTEIAFRNGTKEEFNTLGENHYEKGVMPESMIEEIKRIAGPREEYKDMKQYAPLSLP